MLRKLRDIARWEQRMQEKSKSHQRRQGRMGLRQDRVWTRLSGKSQ